MIERLDAIRVWPYPRKVLGALGAASFFAFYDVVNSGDALPEIAKQFDVSSTTSACSVTSSGRLRTRLWPIALDGAPP